eukprot:jgi/Mesvir1/12035/Mv00325-RA.1
MFACGHQSKLPLLLAASCSTTLPGKNQVKNWTTSDGVLHNITTAQPKVAELYRSYMGVIDHHNALRQGGVAMSDIWGTKDSVVREISESLSMLITNGFFAMRQFVPGFNKSYRDYLVEAGLDLVDNDRIREARATVATLELGDEAPDGHTLKKMDCQSGCSQW